MKNKILRVTILLSTVLFLTGCGTTYQEATGQTESKSNDGFGNGYFTAITKWSDSSNDYKIVYANDTKVKYMVITSGYKMGITTLYNADGTLQIYEESEEYNEKP